MRGVTQPPERLERGAEHHAGLRHQRPIRQLACSTPRTSRSRDRRPLTEARNLYALLTGRVTAITGTARLDAATGKYVYNGDLAQQVPAVRASSAFLADSWRATPTLTLNGGLRWDVQLPFTPADDTWSTGDDRRHLRHLRPGRGAWRARTAISSMPSAQSGVLIPAYDRFEAGMPAHKTNWLDLAPNAGVAWRPNVQNGWLRTLLGDPDQATVRAGYALSYNQERIDRFTVNAGSNPGGTVTWLATSARVSRSCSRARVTPCSSASDPGSGRRPSRPRPSTPSPRPPRTASTSSRRIVT